jgi:nicotinamidase/pyrazinamidase
MHNATVFTGDYAMAQERTHLLIIDPQNDFCDLPDTYCPADPTGKDARLRPALPVPGAHADLQRIAALIDHAGAGFDEITVTLDSHQHIDIAHPTFWKQEDGSPVAPFTSIQAAEVRAGRYLPRVAGHTTRSLAYLDALEQAGRYLLMVWPVHCEIGSWGHNVHHDLRRTYNAWEEATSRTVRKLTKGENPWTEHYSAIRAEVPDPADPATRFNHDFVNHLMLADRLYIAGEAGSHCVKATTEHIVQGLNGDGRKLTLLTDCMSPVTGFEAQYQAFLQAMRDCGARLATSEAVASELIAAY